VEGIPDELATFRIVLELVLDEMPKFCGCAASFEKRRSDVLQQRIVDDILSQLFVFTWIGATSSGMNDQEILECFDSFGQTSHNQLHALSRENQQGQII
jgi:hypothetical protein